MIRARGKGGKYLNFKRVKIASPGV